MEALKELFGDGQLSYAEFEKAVRARVSSWPICPAGLTSLRKSTTAR